MLLPGAREAIVATCRELSRAGPGAGAAGNVSVREGGLVAVTPSGVRYAGLTPELAGVHRLGGAAVEAPLAPASELARNVVHALHDRTACLMGGHGAVTAGPGLLTAHDRSASLEWLSDVHPSASPAGAPRLLPSAEIAAVARKMAGYGQRPPVA